MLCTNLVMSKMQASSKKQAFQEMAARMAELCGADEERLLSLLIEREKIGTTGIGGGVAIPHVKLQGIPDMIGALAVLERPVDYDALDEKPVDVIFMLLAPDGIKSNLHLKMLARISRFLRDPLTAAQLRGTQNADSAREIISEWQNSQAA